MENALEKFVLENWNMVISVVVSVVVSAEENGQWNIKKASIVNIQKDFHKNNIVNTEENKIKNFYLFHTMDNKINLVFLYKKIFI